VQPQKYLDVVDILLQQEAIKDAENFSIVTLSLRDTCMKHGNILSTSKDKEFDSRRVVFSSKSVTSDARSPRSKPKTLQQLFFLNIQQL
jgi:hypothetical protein